LDLVIFWNHVGREHGVLEYTEDIRKNSPEVIQNSIELKEQRCRNNGQLNRFVRYDETTLLELPPSQSDRKYIIIYCIDQGLQFSLNFKPRYPWWLIDIVDIQEIRPNYDMDEYEIALSSDVMSTELISQSLKSFHTILSELNSKTFPNDTLKAIEMKYM
jgi:hypothetical protein